MNKKSRIELIASETEWQLWMAREDYATLTGQEFIEKPCWYRDKKTERCFYGIYGCVGWPSEVRGNERGVMGAPGYAAVIGVLRPEKRPDNYDPSCPDFLLLDEAEEVNVQSLINECLNMRVRWGFGLNRDLLTAWYGDPDRFLTTLALINERRIAAKGEREALAIIPPFDFYEPGNFDQYARSIQSIMHQSRFYYGKNKVLKKRLKGFMRDDPAVMAVGGLIHTLMMTPIWMNSISSAVFTVDG